MHQLGIEPRSNPCKGFILTTVLLVLYVYYSTYLSHYKERQLSFHLCYWGAST